MPLQVLAFAGSLRKASFNRKLLDLAIAEARSGGGEVDLLEFRDLALPLYDADVEAASGLPEGAQELRRRIARAPAVVIASPEYNASIPGPLKNAIDWSSRPPQQPWRDKVVLTIAASVGPGGGMRMLPDLRKVLSVLGAHVIPSTVGVRNAGDAFDEAGKLKDPANQKALGSAVRQLLDIAAKLGGSGA